MTADSNGDHMSTQCSNNPGIAFILFSILILWQSGCTERASNGQISEGEKSSAEAVRLTLGTIDASEPDIAADENGNVYVVYVEHQDALNADIKLLRFGSEGKPTGEATRVNSDAGAAKVWAGDPPRIAVRGQNVYIAWTRKFADRAVRGNDLVLSVSRDAGTTFEPPVRVNDDVEPASHGMHSIDIGGNGDVIMLWLDERSLAGKTAPMTSDHEMAEPNAEVYYAVSKDGGRSFGLNRKIAEEVCPCCKTALLADQEGAIYASWRQVLEGDHRHIAVARSDNGGETFNERVIVSDDKWQISACPVSGAALVAPRPGTLDVLMVYGGRCRSGWSLFCEVD